MPHLYWTLLCFVLVWHKGLTWWVLIWRMLLPSLVWCHVTQASGMLLEAMQASAIFHKKSIPWILTTPSACAQEEHIWSRPEPNPKENTEDPTAAPNLHQRWSNTWMWNNDYCLSQWVWGRCGYRDIATWLGVMLCTNDKPHFLDATRSQLCIFSQLHTLMCLCLHSSCVVISRRRLWIRNSEWQVWKKQFNVLERNKLREIFEPIKTPKPDLITFLLGVD